MINRNIYKDILFGIAIGDAVGVPAEFKKREELDEEPVKDMTGYGTHQQPAGTFSDDSSLTFCLAEALTRQFNLKSLADNFIRWLHLGYWTAHGNVFDVGISTRASIERLRRGCDPVLAGGMDVSENGNGSLMRILPLVGYIKNKTIAGRYEVTRQVSSLTHAHARSVISCFYYLEFAKHILEGKDKFDAYKSLQTEIPAFLHSIAMNPAEINLFSKLLEKNIAEAGRNEISGSGYVLHCLEASIYCILTTNNYKEAVLKAVNLGLDTDTTAAVTGGLAGLIYGYENIPVHWLNQLVRKDDIAGLAERVDQFLKG